MPRLNMSLSEENIKKLKFFMAENAITNYDDSLTKLFELLRTYRLKNAALQSQIDNLNDDLFLPEEDY
jgi:hypothetical protein